MLVESLPVLVVPVLVVPLLVAPLLESVLEVPPAVAIPSRLLQSPWWEVAMPL